MHLTLGSEGETVQELQERLTERGYDVGPVDGRFGPRTRDAVAALQREQGLTADGAVDAATAEELGLDVDATQVDDERANFRQLLMGNPNYFGNRPGLDYEPVTEVVAEDSYEALTCVGYDPGASRLDAVVRVKRDAGYGGDLCSDGSVEYVRFFLDRDRDGDWESVGVASTQVYDVAGEKPLDYAVSVELDQELEPCNSAVLPRVRAVLSWEQEPPDDETFRPVWGSRLEADIQLDPREPTVGELVDENLVDPDMLEGVDLEAPMPAEPPTLDATQLLMEYADSSVPPHRAGFSEFKQLLGGPTGPTGPGGPGGPDGPEGPLGPDPPFPPDPLPGPFPQPVPDPSGEFDLPPGFDFDAEDVVEDLFETAGNTSYEELDCVGYRDGVLAGLLTVKRPSGYSGGLCTAGSPEYVAFWEKPVSGGSWSHVGTGSVTVHDLSGVPADGLQYAVHLPADLSDYRQPCGQGPGLVRVRAVLSWNRHPPASDPNFTPTWGNSVETVVHVPPGPDPGEGLLQVGTVGNVVPAHIDQTTTADTTGTATGPLVSSGGSVTASRASFGGRVTITGRPQGFSPTASGADSLQYRLSVKPHDAPDSAYRPLTNEFQVSTYADPGRFQPVRPDSDGFYTYVPGALQNLLAVWHTSDDGLYSLKFEAKRGDGDPVDAAVRSEPDGTTETELLIRLDNTAPEAEIEITSVLSGGSGSPEPADECDFFTVGDTIQGTFTADDDHFRAGPTGWAPYRFGVSPGGRANGATPTELSRNGQTVMSRDGGQGDWQLRTQGMDSCGYSVQVRVVDNVIVNNDYSGHRTGDSEGFCLLEPGQEVVEEEEEEEDDSA